MALPDIPAPSPLLLDRRYWQDRLSRMDAVGRGLLILPRKDLTTPVSDVVEWRMKAYDTVRLWGLRGINPFHPAVDTVCIRAADATELPEIDLETLGDGCAELVYQVPAGRKLEDRVLDVLRVLQLAMTTFDVQVDQVHLVPGRGGNGPRRLPDEFMIAQQLVQDGLFVF